MSASYSISPWPCYVWPYYFPSCGQSSKMFPTSCTYIHRKRERKSMHARKTTCKPFVARLRSSHFPLNSVTDGKLVWNAILRSSGGPKSAPKHSQRSSIRLLMAFLGRRWHFYWQSWPCFSLLPIRPFTRPCSSRNKHLYKISGPFMVCLVLNPTIRHMPLSRSPRAWTA